MNLSRLALIAAVASLGIGCASKNISQYPAPIDTTVETDLKAEIDVGSQITGQASTNILLNLFTFGGDSKYADGVAYGAGGGAAVGLPDPVSKAKAAAAYNAVTASGADVIVAPKYVVDVTDYFVFKQVKVNVTGYAGKITSVR